MLIKHLALPHALLASRLNLVLYSRIALAALLKHVQRISMSNKCFNINILAGLLYVNKNLKFKKGVGITIKDKETSSKLASYEITDYPLYKLHWLLFVSVYTNLQELIPTLAP